MLIWIVAVVVLAALGAFAATIVNFNIKRVRVIRAAEGIPDSQLEAIYQLVESAGTEPSSSYVLGRTNRPAPDAAHAIELPQEIGDVPWAGRQIVIQAAGDEVSFGFTPHDGHGTRLAGRMFRVVRVLQARSKAGKPRRIFSPARYVAASPALKDALEGAFSRDPTGLLSYLLCTGRDSFEFDEINQARIAASPVWVQNPETPACDRCRRRMQLIVQVPGSMIAAGPGHEDAFYLFGCPSHPDVTRTIGQRT
jgi:hypothetical protein